MNGYRYALGFYKKDGDGIGRVPVAPDLDPLREAAWFDALRADHLGCYGYFRDTSPVIDQLAREPDFAQCELLSSEAVADRYRLSERLVVLEVPAGSDGRVEVSRCGELRTVPELMRRRYFSSRATCARARSISALASASV